MARLSIFDHLKNLTELKVDFDPLNDDQVKSYEPFMINKFISMSEMFVPLIHQINRYNLDKETHYRYLLAALPKRKQYFGYVKKNKEHDPRVVECVCRYYQIGPRQIDEYLDILDDEQIEEIVQIYESGVV